MDRKTSPPALHLIQAVENAQTVIELKRALDAMRFVGDLKQVAERMGLHYLKSKRMRRRELRQWIVDNHGVNHGHRGSN